MKKFLTTLLIAAGLFAQPAGAQNTANKISDQQFIRMASESGQFEVQSSKLALEQTEDQNVRTFARRMIDDHTEANEDLKDIVNKNNSLSAAELQQTLNAKHQTTYGKLQNLQGADFDRAYINAQVDAHREAVNLFQNYSQKGASPDLREFAREKLPTLQEHLNDVQQLQADNNANRNVPMQK